MSDRQGAFGQLKRDALSTTHDVRLDLELTVSWRRPNRQALDDPNGSRHNPNPRVPTGAGIDAVGALATPHVL